ncbi:MAG: Mrp/NBP35 family ATP-binding protein [Bacteriovoracaceae bacterium]|nr:Mrp/NBP35 family ATP-binding protein [Bacteriovoracaceae bacterium]
MIDKITTLLANIKNPHTGLTLREENRWLNFELKDEKYYIKYKRDGIGPLDKRKIEEDILSALREHIEPEKILVLTVSERSEEVFKSLKAGETKTETPAAAPAKGTQEAQLKVGHGTVGNKRKIEGVKNIICVASGKGGVGKSTVSANLAVTLNMLGKKVGLIDADIYGPSLPMIMGKRGEKPFSNSEKKIVPLEAHGVKFMSFGFFIEENEPVIWRGPMLGGVLSQFLFDVAWGELDYLIIDLPPGTGDMQLSMVQNAHLTGAIVVSTPQDVALLDATKGLEMFRKVQVPIIGMVENMSTFICSKCGTAHDIFGHGGVEVATKKLGVPFLGSIPLELELRTASDTGRPYMAQNQYESRAVWKSFIHLAKSMIEENNETTDNKAKGLFKRIFS